MEEDGGNGNNPDAQYKPTIQTGRSLFDLPSFISMEVHMMNKVGNIGTPITGSIVAIDTVSNIIPVRWNGMSMQYEICERSQSSCMAMVCNDIHNKTVTILIGNKIDRSVLVDII